MTNQTETNQDLNTISLERKYRELIEKTEDKYYILNLVVDGAVDIMNQGAGTVYGGPGLHSAFLEFNQCMKELLLVTRKEFGVNE